MAQARHTAEHPDLHLLRHGGGEALDVQFFSVEAHGLHKQLVAELVREPDHLGLKGGAVAGAHPLNDAGVHGRPVQILPDDPERLLRGPGEPADRPILRRGLGAV